MFLTRTSEAETSWVEKKCGYFIVHGESGATFDWMIVGYQRDYVTNRMENLDTLVEPVNNDPIYEEDTAAVDAVDQMVAIFNSQVEDFNYDD